MGLCVTSQQVGDGDDGPPKVTVVPVVLAAIPEHVRSKLRYDSVARSGRQLTTEQAPRRQQFLRISCATPESTGSKIGTKQQS